MKFKVGDLVVYVVQLELACDETICLVHHHTRNTVLEVTEIVQLLLQTVDIKTGHKICIHYGNARHVNACACCNKT
jgi:hypothetical protein